MTSRIKLPFKLGDSKKITEIDINEPLKKDDFSLSEIVRYGFPYRPTTLAYDPVQKVLAIGTKNGIIKIYGGAFVECSLEHPSEIEIVQLVFRINEGALISACRDNYIHLWNLRQKKPVIASSLRFVKEKISRCFLPLAFNSKWLMVGTYCGNVYVVNLDTFTLSSYKIMWNNAIGMGKSSHPGVVVDLCQNPDDPTRLYIGFSTHLSSPNSVPVGHVICWNLQQKTSESVYSLSQGLTSLSWHYEGRQFMCSHCDGSLSVWNLRANDKPVSVNYPHTRICKDESSKFGPVSKVIWSAVKSSGDSFVIFSGGMPQQTDHQQSSSKPSSYFLTILRGQSTNVLHMDNSIIDFHVITPSPHIADVPDALAVVVLLENDLVVIDLKTENYPLFESLHTLDLHESPITYCDYITEPNTNFYQNLLRLQAKQTTKRTYSQLENPISGGRSGSTIFGYNELIITGHADGSIKFWDASGCNLVFLYKLRTNRLFDRIQVNTPTPSQPTNTNSSKEINSNIKFDTKSTRTNSNTNDEQLQQILLSDDNPFSIYSIKMCCDGKYLIAAGRGGHVTLFKFTGSELDKADEGLGDLACLEVPIFHRNLSSNHDDMNSTTNSSILNDLQAIAIKQNLEKKELKSLLRAKRGYRRMAGYQPELVCLLSWLPTDKVPLLTDISINSKYGLLIFGLENGLVVIDFLSQFILMNMATADLYGTMDPFQRATSSPKRRGTSNESNNDDSNTFSYEYQPSSPPTNTSNLTEKRTHAQSIDTNSAVYKPLVIDLPRSSSTSSLDNIITNESVCAIQFSESFPYKNDFTISPSVWLGTSTGSVIVINLNIIFEPRNISVVPSGTVFRLTGRILHISFLDHKGAIIPTPSEKWEAKKTKTNRLIDGTQDLNSSSIVLPTGNSVLTATTSIPSNNIQYAVFCSSKEARVISLPSQVSISKQKIYDSLGSSASNIMRAAVVKIAGAACLTCYLAAGRIHVYSLPSLRELFTTTLDPVIDSWRSMIGLSFTFTNRGHGLFMCSPTEIQKITISSDVKEQINEMLCELYSPAILMPEAPKQNFFAKLFASNAIIDSDQLFGEAAGKAPAGVIQREHVNPNINQLRGNTDSAASTIHDTRMKLLERGQKLNEVELASKQMADRAEEFSSLTNKVMLKQKEKAEWSWPFTSKK
ncbi:hypothetical protein I4U23_006909 [Adineta vaga]|nr:hypothetical protein I4U23_006909 [Adineta vaga]